MSKGYIELLKLLEQHNIGDCTEAKCRKCEEITNFGKCLWAEWESCENKGKTAIAVIQYCSLPNGKLKELGRYDSIRQAGEATGTRQNSISRCLTGNFQTAGGYIWKGVEQLQE